MVDFLPRFAGHVLIAAFCEKESLAQQAMAGETGC